MITYEELNTQNHKITELSNVISILIKDRSDLRFGYLLQVVLQLYRQGK